MKDYKVLIPVTLFSGSLRLSKEQAELRKHSLAKGKKKDVYDITAPVMFKAGEVVGIDDIAKAYAPNLEDIEAKAEADAAKEKERAEAEAKAEADAAK